MVLLWSEDRLAASTSGDPWVGASSQSKGLEVLQGSPLTTDTAVAVEPGDEAFNAPGASPHSRGRPPGPRSAAEAQPRDQRAVTGHVGGLQVAQQAAAAADHLQQATAGVVVVPVDLQVLGELVDAGGEQGQLDLGGAGVAVLGGVLGDDPRLVVLDQHDFDAPSASAEAVRGQRGQLVAVAVPRPGRQLGVGPSRPAQGSMRLSLAAGSSPGAASRWRARRTSSPILAISSSTLAKAALSLTRCSKETATLRP